MFSLVNQTSTGGRSVRVWHLHSLPAECGMPARCVKSPERLLLIMAKQPTEGCPSNHMLFDAAISTLMQLLQQRTRLARGVGGLLSMKAHS